MLCYVMFPCIRLSPARPGPARPGPARAFLEKRRRNVSPHAVFVKCGFRWDSLQTFVFIRQNAARGGEEIAKMAPPRSPEGVKTIWFPWCLWDFYDSMEIAGISPNSPNPLGFHPSGTARIPPNPRKVVVNMPPRGTAASNLEQEFFEGAPFPSKSMIQRNVNGDLANPKGTLRNTHIPGS